MAYKLSAALYGHSMDVRALAVTSDGRIISTSRDKTAKVWKPNMINSGFTEAQTLQGHTNFVSSVCVLPASEEYPGGLVLTGSNDNTICAYHLDNPAPVFVMRGHTNTVCCLSPSNNKSTPGVVLSSSWDQTAKVWLISKSEAHLTLTGHQAAVWAVLQVASGWIVTASADKTIRTYQADGKFDRILTGHTDCVRALTALTEPTEFLSCANDATIRKWNVTSGECLDILYGHPNYIYSIYASASGLVVSGGEDRVVHVWEGGKQQAIIVPAQSVWAVSILPNNDIVTGSSDGVVRVFSAEKSRHADDFVLAQFSEEVANLAKAAEQEIGGVKVSDLPGKEALLDGGRADGQTKLIREGGSVVCYSWSEATKEWSKVGDVMGAGGNDSAGTGKTTFNGKEYDYVFTVDIEDGKPPLKLPYNDGEDPWHSAQNFIHQNNLSQQFLEQVANFIISNSRKLDPAANSSSTGGTQQYCDPFTGGARYIPSGAADVQQQPVRNGDSLPETRPQVAHPPSNEAALFPQTAYLRFDTGNLKLILEKLEEFNKKTSSQVTSEQLESVVKLADVSALPSETALRTLQQLLNWSDELLFPILDVMRLGLRNRLVNTALCDEPSRDFTLGVLHKHIKPNSLPANQMLAVRSLSNMLLHPAGEVTVFLHKEVLLADLGSLIAGATQFSKQLQIATATALLNLSILFIKESCVPSQQSTVQLLNTVMPACNDAEAQLRALVALGTLLAANANLLQCTSAAVVDKLHQLASQQTSGQSSKVAACSSQILRHFVTKA